MPVSDDPLVSCQQLARQLHPGNDNYGGYVVAGARQEPRPIELGAVLDEVQGLLSEACSFNMESYEDDQPFAAHEVVPTLADIVLRACQILGALAQLTPESVVGLGARKTPRDLEECGDICFVLKSELRTCGQQLGRLTESELDFYTVLIALERARAKTIDGLGVLATRLGALADREPQPRPGDDTGQALAVRRLTAKFLSRLPTSQDAAADLPATLRRVGGTLAWLVGQEDFSYLRPEERLLAKQMRQLLVEWLREDHPEERGKAIWQELQLFIGLLRPLVRHRTLLEHDLQRIAEAIPPLSEGDPHGPIDYALVRSLDQLFGLDEGLDRLLHAGANKSLVLSRLLQLYEMLAQMAPATDGRVSSQIGRPGHPRHLRLVEE